MSQMKNEIEDGVLLKHQSGSNFTDDTNGGSAGGVVLKKGPWTSAEDAILVDYVRKHGEGNWNAVQKFSGLSRCGKSCRLRWANHLRPNLKKGAFSAEEERQIAELHAKMGNKWARMASHVSLFIFALHSKFLYFLSTCFVEMFDYHLTYGDLCCHAILVFYGRELPSNCPFICIFPYVCS